MIFFNREKKPESVSVYGMTDIGKKRGANEDAYLLIPEKKIYVVSDGMGGHNAGEVASQTAIKALESFFVGIEMQSIPKESISETLINAVLDANKMVRAKGMSANEYSNMGCTVVLVFIDQNILHVGHVGDSRVYLIDKKDIVQVTTDHSVVMELVQAGEMTKAEARCSYLKNQLSQALGISAEVRPEYIRRELKKGDTVLLCTDGLWDMLSDDQIHKSVNEGGTPEKTCKMLLNLANEAGGDDNITVIVTRIFG